MTETKRRRRVLIGVFALALAAGAGGRWLMSGQETAEPIVGADEQLRDAVASLPPAVMPAAIAPSRVAIWASPAMRRADAEKVLLSGRGAKKVTR